MTNFRRQELRPNQAVLTARTSRKIDNNLPFE
jgi:hypothetical protein